jgi:4-hydroxyphenylacetate 3-monooxygenase
MAERGSDCKTGAEHLASLRDGRSVYIAGALVDDVTIHPAFRSGRLRRRPL